MLNPTDPIQIHNEHDRALLRTLLEIAASLRAESRELETEKQRLLAEIKHLKATQRRPKINAQPRQRKPKRAR